MRLHSPDWLRIWSYGAIYVCKCEMEGTLGGGTGSWNVREAGLFFFFFPFLFFFQSLPAVSCLSAVWYCALLKDCFLSSCLSPSDCEAVHSHCAPSRTHTHTGVHSHTQLQLERDGYWYSSTLRTHNLLTFSRDSFSAANPSSLLSFLLLSLYHHSRWEKGWKKNSSQTQMETPESSAASYACVAWFFGFVFVIPPYLITLLKPNEGWNGAARRCPDCGAHSSQERAQRERKCGDA